MYYLRKTVTEAVSKSILITGVARSGTTMMGTLVHSLRNVEFSYEPPFLFSHIPLIYQMPPGQWCLLYETYLFEDFLMEALGGRRLNFNEHDDSCIYRAKDSGEIEARLSGSHRRKALLPLAVGRRIAYKMPDMLPFLDRLHAYYPGMNIIVMFRSPESVAASLLGKGWFSDEGLSEDPMVWPSKVERFPLVPFWVPDQDIELWRGMSEVERCYYYYALMYEHALVNAHPEPKGREDLLIVDYDSFTKHPRKEFDHLVARIGCEFGQKTDELLGSVRDAGKAPESTLTEVDARLRQRVLEVAEKCRAIALRRG